LHPGRGRRDGRWCWCWRYGARCWRPSRARCRGRPRLSQCLGGQSYGRRADQPEPSTAQKSPSAELRAACIQHSPAWFHWSSLTGTRSARA
jgi:hypothetical protein